MTLLPKFIRLYFVDHPIFLKITDNILWLFFDKIIRMIVGLFLGVWVARYLGPHQFGLFSFSSAFIGLFGAFTGLGLQGIVVRNLVINTTDANIILGTAAVLQFIAAIFTYILALVVIFLMRPDDQITKTIVAILGLAMLFNFSDVATYWFESQVLSKYIVWVQNSTFLFFAIVKVIFIFIRAPLLAFVYAATAEVLLAGLLMVIMFNLHGRVVRQLRASMILAKTLLYESWPLMLSGITIMVYMRIDQIMLGQIIGDEAVGVYSAALRISEVWYFLPMGIVASVFPSILKAKENNEDNYRKHFQQLYDLMVWMSIFIALPMTFISNNIVIFLFGKPYASAGPVLAIHVWACVFVFLGVASSKWFIVEKRQILHLQRSLLGVLVNVILNIFLIPIFGVLGAAWATVIAQFSSGLLFDAFQKETHQMFLMKINAFNMHRIFHTYFGRGYK